MALLLGCVGDDSTGSTDLANTLVKQGLRTVQLIGVPDQAAPVPDAEAIVIALKSRTAPVDDAVSESLAALRWLREAGARQFFFKYCSTFDSTEEGNIGPVTEAMMAELDCDLTIACPAFPTTGRTVYQGHLFVFDKLLSETHMRDHPLTPMTDSNLVRFLGKQTALPVGLVACDDVIGGVEGIRAAFTRLRGEGKRIAIVDAVSDEQLHDIGAACGDMVLITGGSGVAIGLPENFRRSGLAARGVVAAEIPAVAGPEAVIAGSCSEATLGQLAHVADKYPIFRVDPDRLAASQDVVGEALDWAVPLLGRERPVFASSDDADMVRAAQEEFGRMEIGTLIERAMAAIAKGLVEKGVRRLIVAGGETSGAVVEALGVTALRIGPEIDPGVPWCETIGDLPLALALKSGNFGAEDFFVKAFGMLP